MDQPNRINPLAFNVTGARQTPKNEFGQVLATTLTGAVKTGAGVVGSLPGMPVISAAVNAVTGIVSTSSVSGVTPVSSQSAMGTAVVLGGGASGSGTSAASGASPDRPVYENGQVREMAAMSDYYMRMQNEMQRESREFNAISNIIKVRHDSAKAAINNIR
ncbi:MAG: hypothetical protein IPJ65_06365 [Archangiaceae bacterium]|nr:hypothetical protein [Archangiaceae bacterium]